MEAKGNTPTYQLFILFLALCVLPEGIYGYDCLTPKNERGSCVPLRSCGSVLAVKRAFGDRKDVNDYFRNSRCGRRNSPMTCCPNNGKTGFEYLLNEDLLPDLTQCGPVKDDKIIGGKGTDIDEYPWMVLLVYSNGNDERFACGGALISSRYVLTAAHCVEGFKRSSWKLKAVRLGEYDLNTDPDCSDIGCNPTVLDVPIEHAISHESYLYKNKNQHYDIALIRLKNEVTFGKSIRPICLPSAHSSVMEKTFLNDDLTVAGWGKTENGTHSDVKLQVDLNVVRCQSLYQSIGFEIKDSQMCAGGKNGKDSCRGDSGGPLFASFDNHMFAIGIVSHGPQTCGLEDWPGIYTRVASFSDWIKNNMEP